MVHSEHPVTFATLESVRTYCCEEFVAIDFTPESRPWKSILAATGIDADQRHKVRLIRCSHRGVVLFWSHGEFLAWAWTELLTP